VPRPASSSYADPLTPRVVAWALGAIVLGGWVIRVFPLLREGGAFAFPIDYDEGVYFSASALLFRGALPYRDFVFVHPPGLLYALGLTSAFADRLDAASAFAAARFLATVVGAANVLLVGRVALRWAGPLAGLVAAALYATYPEVVTVERGPYLEPVLNLACLAMALAWISGKTRSAGALCGAACAVKVWGGLWLLAALLSRSRDRRWWEATWLVAAAAVVGLVLVLPLAAAAPGHFWTDALLFHAWRPPDGDIARLSRLGTIIGGSHVVASVLAVGGFATWLAVSETRDWSRELRFFGAAYALSVAAFLASSGYWSQYNSHLAASEAVLAGFGATALWSLARATVPRLERASAPVLLVAIAAIAFPSARGSILRGRARAPEQLAVGQAIRKLAPAGECVFAFEPAWGLAGGHLPPRTGSAPVLVDPYAAMLLGAVETGSRFPDAGSAFQSAGSQAQARALLDGCRFAVLGWRGRWQLSADTQAWFREHFVQRHPAEGAEGIDLWERVR